MKGSEKTQFRHFQFESSESRLQAAAVLQGADSVCGDSHLLHKCARLKASSVTNIMESRSGLSLHDLPDDVVSAILYGVEDRDQLSLVCKKWYQLERALREELDFGINAPKRALSVLLYRFFNLTSLEINYCDEKYSYSEGGQQIDDDCLRHISLGCANLNDVSLHSCKFVTDAGIASVALCSKLSGVRLTAMPLVTETGLFSIVSGCSLLKLLHVDELISLSSGEWVEYIGMYGLLESLAVENCAGVNESDLVKLGRRGWKNLRNFVYSWTGPFGLLMHTPPLQNWQLADPNEKLYCPNLERLWLWNSSSMSTTGLLSILGHCTSLRELEIDQCAGFEDKDMIRVATGNPQIAFLSMTINCNRPYPKLTNLTLVLIAEKLRLLKSLRLTFLKGTFRPNVLEDGLVAIVKNCKKLESLVLFFVPCVGEDIMKAIGRSTSLTDVYLAQCHDLTDGMVLLMGSKLRRFTLLGCPLLTDGCLSHFRASPPPSTVVTIAGCPGISEEAALEVARVHDTDSE